MGGKHSKDALYLLVVFHQPDIWASPPHLALPTSLRLSKPHPTFSSPVPISVILFGVISVAARHPHTAPSTLLYHPSVTVTVVSLPLQHPRQAHTVSTVCLCSLLIRAKYIDRGRERGLYQHRQAGRGTVARTGTEREAEEQILRKWMREMRDEHGQGEGKVLVVQLTFCVSQSIFILVQIIF